MAMGPNRSTSLSIDLRRARGFTPLDRT
jgi:hypothetical protein